MVHLWRQKIYIRQKSRLIGPNCAKKQFISQSQDFSLSFGDFYVKIKENEFSQCNKCLVDSAANSFVSKKPNLLKRPAYSCLLKIFIDSKFRVI